MQEIKKIIQKLQATNGKIEKEQILTKNKDNILLQKILQFVYNPLIISGLSSKKINKTTKIQSTTSTISNIEQCLTYLESNKTGTDQDICNIQSFINSQPPEFHSLYIAIITKTLKLGCDSKTINKAFGKGFIRIHEVQQAYPLEKYKLKIKEWISLSQKLNGIRGSYTDGRIISRQGHEILGLESIIKDIQALNLVDPFIDGELIRKNPEGLLDNENFRLTASIVNSDSADKSNIEFVFFDILSNDDFIQGESFEDYSNRLDHLLNVSTIVQNMRLKNIQLVDILYSGRDHSKIAEYLEIMDAAGKEGLILNRNTSYKFKRNNGILKVKSFFHCDVRCKRIELGTGKNEKTLGSIVVDYKGFECGVGSGFTDEQRNFYFSNQDEIMGRIVQVKYKEESKNKNGGLSLQFPIFECVRNDKTKPSYN